MNLVDKAQRDIRQMILDKKYNDDLYLPSEGELCKMLSVSRSTVREAVKSLEIRGFVQRKHGKGILVVDKTEETLTRSIDDMFASTSITLKEILELRRIIEVPGAGLAAENAQPSQITKLENVVKLLEQLDKIDENYIEEDLHFHLILIDASNNTALIAITRAYTPIIKKLIIKATENRPEDLESVSHYHRNILNAVKNGDVDESKSCMDSHLIATKENSGVE
jgi:GntR family transcriptional repressor for pyruvate dehydrogenase complex